MRYSPRNLVRLGFLWLTLAATVAVAGEPFHYREAQSGSGRLQYLAGLPVLSVAGTPEAMGQQEATLTGDAARSLLKFPRDLLRMVGQDGQWPKFVDKAEQLLRQSPQDYRTELKAFGRTAGLEDEILATATTMVDLYRGGFGCSSLVVETSQSTTGGPLFGRNLDFFGRDVLQKYSLVTIYHPQGKRTFASIGFPGLLGCLSGMNDAGLAVAVHEVYLSKDGGSLFNPKGVPYVLCFRRILEECSTVEEAEKLVRGMERTTLLNLAICDRSHSAVIEMTPKTVVLRPSEEGILCCTNHFRSKELAMFKICRRYPILEQARGAGKLGVQQVTQKLNEVAQGRLTLQSMVFEPGPLVLHLSVEASPASAGPFKRLALQPLFAK